MTKNGNPIGINAKGCSVREFNSPNAIIWFKEFGE
jgi:hypothetical protein